MGLAVRSLESAHVLKVGVRNRVWIKLGMYVSVRVGRERASTAFGQG